MTSIIKELLVRELRELSQYTHFVQNWAYNNVNWIADSPSENGVYFGNDGIYFTQTQISDITANDDFILDTTNYLDNEIIRILSSYSYKLEYNKAIDAITLQAKFSRHE